MGIFGKDVQECQQKMGDHDAEARDDENGGESFMGCVLVNGYTHPTSVCMYVCFAFTLRKNQSSNGTP